MCAGLKGPLTNGMVKHDEGQFTHASPPLVNRLITAYIRIMHYGGSVAFVCCLTKFSLPLESNPEERPQPLPPNTLSLSPKQPAPPPFLQ